VLNRRLKNHRFQEQLLSPRTLTFLPNGSVFFRCLRAQWSKEDTNELRPEETTWKPDYLYSALGGEMSTVASFDALVLSYSERTLSFQADAQRAFHGFESLLQEEFACEFVQSMPTSAFDLFVLFTGHFNTLTRRKEFPSWSWLGWIGKVNQQNRALLVRLDDCREWLTERTWIVWYHRTAKGEWKDVWTEEDAVKVPKTKRHVTYGPRRGFNNKYCPTVDVSNTIPDRNFPLLERVPKDITTLHFWSLSVFLKISAIVTAPLGNHVGERGTIIDADGKFCGSIHLDDFCISKDRNFDKPREFIVLSEACDAMGGSAIENREIPDKSRWDLYWVMLIVREGENAPAERRGIGQIYQDAVRRALTPGPVWKEFVLG
jgi:hypothetical protein